MVGRSVGSGTSRGGSRVGVLSRVLGRVHRAEPGEREAHGVRATAAALTGLAGLEAGRWHVFGGVTTPDEPGTRLHVVVGPPGVLVVGSKNWNGAVRAAQGVLRHDGARRERDLAEASRAAAAVRTAYGVDEDVPVIGVLCFVPPAMVTGWIGEVLLCATGDVVAVLDRLARRLDRERVGEVAALFDPAEAGPGTRLDAVPVVPAVPAVGAQAGA